ncbi:3,4-dihydroxy-2-butanone-4-phosphate synthase [Brachybacterium sp. ACRRE]|uniref:3,4-dihydroxy-2-butanone-4-phosphate synthase n=1 Tax=Brachybacterium sp. ACRRE TaxID=2918184 RepID=UPI001EF33BB6|nr:3,4-dihydroxy-2-butanone-4-phosphate synthase [Brachybacterium sp. ACRRE]MCG7310382.1 3,4-dihydroxy-2-butanone-4-phosphate synthase [Brachybacterium sp. ACRRE]
MSGATPTTAGTTDTTAAGALIPGTREARIDAALAELRAGRPVLVADSEDRENEVDAIISAQLATPRWVGWMVRRTSGYLCAPMPAEIADHLELPLMVPRTEDSLRTAYTVSVDAARGVTTGISASDRATTLRALADPRAVPADLIRPGHVIPLRAVPGGVGERPGHTEAAVDLCRAAGLPPVGAIGELVRDDGEVMRLEEASVLAADEGLVLLTIADLVDGLAGHPGDRGRAGQDAGQEESRSAGADPRAAASARVEHTGSADLPTRHGAFRIHGFRDLRTGADHVALVADPPEHPAPAAAPASEVAPASAEAPAPAAAPGSEVAPALVRVHSECLTGEAFGSLRCECGPQLEESLRQVAERGGAVIYLRGHEGRGIGLLEKIAAYDLQDHGFDTLTANLERGFEGDLREYGAAAAILRDLGLEHVDLLTNNPQKAQELARHGIDVARTTRLLVGRTPHNARYLRTKAEAMGHLIPLDTTTTPATATQAATTQASTPLTTTGRTPQS